VSSICQAYVEHAIQGLNPGYTITVTKARCRGDPYCEMVIGRKE
jgi:hypothetical protein